MQTRLPSLRGIEAFIHAAETLSFRAAAERLHVTVSAISHRIHALEEEVGLRLFDRSGRKLSLTPAGSAYRERLSPVISELRQATQAIYTATESQVLRIASFQLLHAHWLAPRIAGFVAQHPGAKIELLTLRRRKVIHPDIVIRILRSGEEGVENEQLFDWNITPICRPELVERHGLRVPADLARAPLVESASAPDVWSRWWAAAGLDTDLPQGVLVADSPSLQMELVAHGAGVGITADFLAEHHLREGLVHPFPISCHYPGGVFVNRATEMERPIVKAFRSWLQQEAAATVRQTSSRTTTPRR